MSTEEKMASEETFNENEKTSASEVEMNEMSEEDAAKVTAEAETDPAAEEAPEENAASEESEKKTPDSEETAGQETGEEGQEEDGGPEAESEEESDKVSLFGGKKLKKEIAKKAEQISELTDRNMRLMAEFDNYRKRTEKEKAAMYGMGAKDVVEKILPVIDNFERGFSLVAEEDMEDPFTQGMEKIYKQFLTVLEGLGVTPIEAVGKEFDPNYHNAVMHVDDENYGENIVVEEFQKGYLYKDSVVRHSMVKVAN